MDYIAYNQFGNMIKRFHTRQEGVDWIDKTRKEWTQLGMVPPIYRLCYNGKESILVYEPSNQTPEMGDLK